MTKTPKYTHLEGGSVAPFMLEWITYQEGKTFCLMWIRDGFDHEDWSVVERQRDGTRTIDPRNIGQFLHQHRLALFENGRLVR
jgi:hypothetical protein